MTTKLRVAELDFDQIKTNLIEFLRDKPEFTDYDYEGSALSVLIDMLAYNTHYNAVIGNMMIQELYLDTAVKKQSLALIAKRLGYVPKSQRAPKAVVTLEVFPFDEPSTLTLGKNAKFNTRVGLDTNAIFVTRDAVTINRSSDGRYIFENLTVYEGNNATFRYVVGNPLSQKFEIPNRLVDTTLVRVYVQPNMASTDVEEWVNYDSIVDVLPDTKAYFIKLNESLNYEIYFGDGVIGKEILPGNVITIDYVATNGPVANGASSFTFSDSVNGYSNVVTTTVTPAFGGSLPETNTSIKRNAQNTVLMQNRAVTENDYAVAIQKLIPTDTVAVYGGETLTPAQYGKVFISVKQAGTTAPLLESQKNLILADLKKRAVLSIAHEFIDPEYTFLLIDTNVKYDPKRTSLNGQGIQSLVRNQIRSYGNDNLNTFDSTFEYSRLVSFIDGIDRSIISNDTRIRIRKQKNFIYGANAVYEYDFNTTIKPSNSREQNIQSSVFRSDDYPGLDLYIGDQDGILYFYRLVNGVKQIVDQNVGTVNYSIGLLRFNLTATLSNGGTLSITIEPSNRNILPSRNSIITLEDNDIAVKTMVV